MFTSITSKIGKYYQECGILGGMATEIFKNYECFKGYGSDGRKVRMVGVYGSGKPDTYLANTITTAVRSRFVAAALLLTRDNVEIVPNTIYPLMSIIAQTWRHTAIVGGDDQFDAVCADYFAGVDFSIIPELSLKYFGQVTVVKEPQKSIYSAEFYSAVFWPIEPTELKINCEVIQADESEMPDLPDAYESRYALGPKPGRVLSRICSSVNKDVDFKSKVYGCMVTFKHVPFLYQFCQEVMRRIGGAKMTHTRGLYDIHVAGQTRQAVMDANRIDEALEVRYTLSKATLQTFVTDMSTYEGDLDSFLHYTLNSGVVQCLSEVDV
jgi:hypothetical protein